MPSESQSLRIVVADDNADVVSTLKMLLEMSGHQVFTACDGDIALKVAVEQQPDVSILDIGMPKKNGYELAAELRQACPDTMLVAVSGWGSPRDVEKAFSAGFHHHMTKPADFGQLEKLLSTGRDNRSDRTLPT